MNQTQLGTSYLITTGLHAGHTARVVSIEPGSPNTVESLCSCTEVWYWFDNEDEEVPGSD